MSQSVSHGYNEARHLNTAHLLKVALFQVREVKEELRSMRLEAHTKQLTKELRSARAALENERKLRKVQSDTIKVNLMNMCMLNILHDVDKWGYYSINQIDILIY